MNEIKKVNFRIIAIVLGVSLLAISCNRGVPHYVDGTVRIAGTPVSVDVADSPELRDLGLSGRPDITNLQGMWFVFDTPQRYGFWMKDMNFPIDIIWVNNNRVVEITTNIQPQPGVTDDNLITYAPTSPVDRVLELRAGWADRHGLSIGDPVEFLPKE